MLYLRLMNTKLQVIIRLAVTYEGIVPECSEVKKMQNESTASHMELNCRCLANIVETLQFLARQGLALRGDNSDDI